MADDSPGKNVYSDDVRRLARFQQDTVGTQHLTDALDCCLVKALLVRPGRRGLVATHTIPAEQPIVEYRGSYSLLVSEKDWRDKKGNLFSDWVLFFRQVGDSNARLVIDAREHGSVAKYVRRSCKPNAQVGGFLFFCNGLIGVAADWFWGCFLLVIFEFLV